MKLIIVDLDGTLIDTKDLNYHAYREALELYGYTIDYQYYCEYCNGRHYLDFYHILQLMIKQFYHQYIVQKRRHIKNI